MMKYYGGIGMEDLKPISYEDWDAEFDFSRTPWDPSITSDLLLYDYGWMHYKLISFLPTRKYGDLELCFNYCWGAGLYIKQTMGNKVRYHRITFDRDIFAKYITMYMEKHTAQWKSEYAFFGGEIVIDFYNYVLMNHIEHEVGPIRAFKKKKRNKRFRSREKAEKLQDQFSAVCF